MATHFEILQVEGAQSLAEVRELFEEYWNSFGFTPCFQNFAQELAGLPGSYSPPDGRLALARIGGGAAGCVALRSLMQWIIEEARQAGYGEMLGDTLPVMREALELYKRLGFQVGEPNEVDGKIDLRWKL